MRRAIPLCLLAVVVLSACSRAGERPAPPASDAAVTLTPSPVPSPTDAVSPISPLPAGPRGGRPKGAACVSDSECQSGACVFASSGCAETAQCGELRVRNCYAAIPMCACRSHRTFFGPGGCAGQANEPWELYACPCATDADCVAGQTCVPALGPHREGATRECRAPSPRPVK